MRSVADISLRPLLMVPGIVLLAISNALLLTAFIGAGTGAIRLSLSDLADQIAHEVAAELDGYFRSAVDLNESNRILVDRGVIDLTDQIRRERFFSGQLDIHDHLAMNFVGLPSGAFYGARRTGAGRIEVVRNNEQTGGASRYYAVSPTGEGREFVVEYPGFDPRIRPWYRTAVDAADSVFSPVYRHFVFDDLAVTVSVPLYDDPDTLRAVFGVDVLLDRLGVFLADLGAETETSIFLVEAASGYLVANSFGLPNFRTDDNGDLHRYTADTFPHPTVNALWSAIEPAGDSVATDENSSSLDHWSVAAGRLGRAVPYHNRNLDWQIVLGISRDRFLGTVRAVTAYSLLGVLLLLGALTIAARRVVGVVLAPVDALVTAAEGLSNREWDIEIDTRGANEIGVLSRTFASMRTELRELFTTLEDRVRDRTRELEHANQTKDKFFAIIAHDLRGPLFSTHQLIDMILERHGEMETDEFEMVLTEIGRSNGRVVQLLENLLLWAQSERGTLPFTPEPISLATAVSECADLLQASAANKSIALSSDIPDVTVTADREMMSLILRNLISNAVKFTPRDGSVAVSATLDEDGSMCRVAVEDTGVGIPPEMVDHLFDLTSRSRTGTEGERGSGLGLTIVAEFLHLHGAEPAVVARDGGGTRISFALPVAEPTTPAER
jgi:two-component system sensor histidine kinase/response regulator